MFITIYYTLTLILINLFLLNNVNALATLAVAGTAFAQSVTLSGAIGPEYSRSTAANNQATLANGDAGATNFALTATEDLGGGLKVTAYMQQRFNAVSGANANTADRGLQNVYLGVSGGFGSVIAGRFLTGPSGAYDAFGQWGTKADYANAGVIGQRSDNTVQYTTPSFNGFSATVATTVTSGTNKEYTYARLSYNNGPLSVSYAAEKNQTAQGDKMQDIGASYDLGVAKVMVLNGKATSAAGVDTTNTSVGVRVPMGAATLKASFRSGDSDNGSAVGVDYALSKRTSLYADMGKVSTSGTQTAYRFGMKHSF